MSRPTRTELRNAVTTVCPVWRAWPLCVASNFRFLLNGQTAPTSKIEWWHWAVTWTPLDVLRLRRSEGRWPHFEYAFDDDEQGATS